MQFLMPKFGTMKNNVLTEMKVFSETSPQGDAC